MSCIKHGGLLVATLLGCISVTACNNTDKTANTVTGSNSSTIDSGASLPGDKVVATVNGTAIGEQLLNAYIEQRNASIPAQHNKKDKAQVLDELINFELVIQDALHNNIDDVPDVATQLALQRRNILASAAFREYIRNHPLTEEEMRADYESRMERLSLREYKLRHILSGDEATAKKAIAELAKGKQDFAEIAKKFSTGPSAEKGGDLGWLSPYDMLPEFKTAVENLEKGQSTPAPVKTRFGWHVILVEDTRETPAPPYEQVRERVKGVLQRRQIEEYIAKLREKAQVEISMPDGVEKTTPGTAPAINPSDKQPVNPIQDTLKSY